MSQNDISRRGALKYLGMLAATAAGREFLACWLPTTATHADGHHHLVTIQDAAGPEAPYTPQFFNPEEFEIVKPLTEMILPTDDQPGAKEAKVADYIDFAVFSAEELQPSLQCAWTDGLVLLERESKRQFGKAFRNASEADRVKLLTEMSLPERDTKALHEGYEFFRLVKEMTVEGFYTSKLGLIDVLYYQGMNYFSEFPGCTHPEHQS